MKSVAGAGRHVYVTFLFSKAIHREIVKIDPYVKMYPRFKVDADIERLERWYHGLREEAEERTNDYRALKSELDISKKFTFVGAFYYDAFITVDSEGNPAPQKDEDGSEYIVSFAPLYPILYTIDKMF